MKVVLINPPSPYLEDDTAYPPSGLMYLAAAIPDHDVCIVDLAVDSTLPIPIADLYGITCVTPNLPIVREIAQGLPGPTVAGGPHATFLPSSVLNDVDCDSVVVGEGERVIRSVLADAESGTLEHYYYGDNTPVYEIPRPARHLVNLESYRSTVVYTSRGCPFSCAFCSKVTGRTFRAFPIERVVEEVIELRDRHIVFGDDNIAVNDVRLRRLLAALIPLGVTFRLNQDARDVDRDTLELAKRAGCTEISFGIESGSQAMLDAMDKRTTVEANRRAVLTAKECGLRVKAYLMVNFPGETESTVQETIRFVEETKPDEWLLSSFVPLPGSDTFNHPEKYGITWMSSNWGDYYLVGRGGKSPPCFTTAELSIEKQLYLHDLLYRGLR